MKIACLGGGPGGLYFAISMKLRDPSHEIDVYERNKPDDTFGWGVVFSDATMGNLRANDPVSAKAILDEFAHWDDIDVWVENRMIRSGGHGFCGIGRRRLLQILQERARELGVRLHFEHDAAGPEDFPDADLVIASDGINSKVRNQFAERFGADVEVRKNKFCWLGTHKLFDAFNFIFKKTEHGWVWVHAYRFDRDTSTVIVECSEETWRGFGFGDMTQAESIATCERIFADHLDGHKLMSNAKHLRGSAWLNFSRVLCKTWYDGKVILIGDAAHTAHFSIGSGTKLAFEDAIKLAEVLNNVKLSLADGLEQYQEERYLEVLKLQSAARNSTDWFEDVERYLQFEPEQFAYSLLTRSQRVSHESLRARDPAWLARLEGWLTEKATGRPANKPVPPMFLPFRLREMELTNRVVVSPMSMYSAVDGTPNEFHVVHYGARAQGGAGLVVTEMTDVSPEGRITPGCAGLWNREHVEAWSRIVRFVHDQSDARIALQLGHAGPKGSTQLGWERMDAPLADGNWPLLAASAVPWSPENQVPRAMAREDMDKVVGDYARSAELAEACGFDMLELHYAHGYLLSSFITPLTNKRTDEYGGTLENRLRFPLEVFRAVRASFPDHKPISVRISATDWVGEQGVTPDEAVEIAATFAAAGVDLIDVSAGQTTRSATPVYGRMFQTPFADQIRNEAHIATMAVGNIYEPDHVNGIIAAGRADLCAIARAHLTDPFWTLRAAAQLGYDGVRCPPQYLTGFAQAKRNAARAEAALLKA